MKKRIIWSNINIDYEQWKADYIQERRENGCERPEDVSYSEVWFWIQNRLQDYLDDERYNLSVDTDGDILVIADLGFWNGRRQGYQILDGNIRNIFSTGEEFTEWYSDGYNIKATAVHHDGTHYMEYRVFRQGHNIQKLLDAIYNGEEIDRKKLNYYTKSLLPYVAKVYGW